MTEKLHPNILTLLRILLVPLPCLFLLNTSITWQFLGLTLLSLLAFTDYLDGALARRHHKVSSIGRVLDPIADKIFVSSIYLFLVHAGYLAFLPVFFIILRELLVRVLRIWFPEKTQVKGIAKVKTFVQMSFVALVILNHNFTWFPNQITYYLTWGVAFFSYLSSFWYFKDSLSKGFSPTQLLNFFSSLGYPLFLLFVFPFSGKLFWIPIVAIDFFFFKKALAKSSKEFAVKDNSTYFFAMLVVILEKVFYHEVHFSLYVVLTLSILKDGFKSFKFVKSLLSWQ